MPRLALVLPSQSYRAAELLDGAARLGAEVVVVSDARQVFAAAAPERFLLADLADPEAAAQAIVELDRRLPIDGVLSVDDGGLLTAALAAAALGLPHSPVAAVALTRDKVAMRRCFAAAEVEQPRFAVVDPAAGAGGAAAAAAGLGFPVVVKPPTLSGSRGVIRADSSEQAAAAARRARAILRDAGEPDDVPLLVERFVPGEEIALEGLLRGGRLDVLAVFDKPDPLDGPYFEETLYVTPSRHPARRIAAATATVAAACAAIGLEEGPVHAELRLPPGGSAAVCLEVAARTIGGRCAKALRFAAGATLDDLVVAHALGLALGEAPPLERRAAGVLMIPIPGSGRLVAVHGVEVARAVPGVRDIELTIPVGEHVRALPEGDRYLGFVFARAVTPAAVEAVLREAWSRISVEVAAEAAGGGPAAGAGAAAGRGRVGAPAVAAG